MSGGGKHRHRRRVAGSRVQAETCRGRRRQSGNTEGQIIGEPCSPRDSYAVTRARSGGDGLRRRRGGKTKRRAARRNCETGSAGRGPIERGDTDGTSDSPGGNCGRNRPGGILRECSRHSIERNGRGPGEVRAGNRHRRSNLTEGRPKRAEADPFEEGYDIVGRGGPNRGSVDRTGKRRTWRAVEKGRIIECEHILQCGCGAVVEERTQIGDIEKLADGERTRSAGCAELAWKIVHSSRVDGLVHHTGVEYRRVSENRPAVANRASGGTEKGNKASLLRGRDRVQSCRELLRPHERFQGSQLIRGRQPEIRIRSTAVSVQRPREVLGDGCRRERSQVADVAAKPKRAKSLV